MLTLYRSQILLEREANHEWKAWWWFSILDVKVVWILVFCGWSFGFWSIKYGLVLKSVCSCSDPTDLVGKLTPPVRNRLTFFYFGVWTSSALTKIPSFLPIQRLPLFLTDLNVSLLINRTSFFLISSNLTLSLN